MEKLFTEFAPHTAQDWKNQLLKELKGDNYESLQWQNENGFVVEPFYVADGQKNSYHPVFNHSDWDISGKAVGTDTKAINASLLRQLALGASSVFVALDKHAPDQLFQNIGLSYIRSSFLLTTENAEPGINWLKQNVKATDLNGSLFSKSLSSTEELAAWEKVVVSFSDYKNVRPLAVTTLGWHNQNCTASYEVAIAISALVEYLEFYKDKKLPGADFVVYTGVSQDFFVQMSKLRAMRRLWNVFKDEYGIQNNIYIIAETSLTNKSVSDSYNNLLRSTTEAIAAVAGGCNELLVNGFDVLFGQSSSLAERMAINQQHILKYESYLDKMADVACGSYYIENLTDKLAEKALEKFKAFEEAGGYFSCLNSGLFTKEIKEQAASRQKEIYDLSRLAIGVTKFRNEKEKISLSEQQLKAIKEMGINNPVLSYELEKLFGYAQIF